MRSSKEQKITAEIVRNAFNYNEVKNDKPVFLTQWEPSGWVCYMFGNRPGRMGLVYHASKGSVPNWFVRWMMRVTLDCLWVKEDAK